MDYKYQGIILGKIDVGEVDRFYTAYTKEAGKVRLLGKGVRKPNAKLVGNLEPLTQTEIFFARSRGAGNIVGAIGVNFFPKIKENFLASRSVFFVLGILGKIITEEEKDEEVFGLLLEYLESVEDFSGAENDKDEKEFERKIDILSFGFLLKLLERSGYGLELEKCVSCKRKLFSGGNFFSAESGGVLCQECARGRVKVVRANDESIKLGRIILQNEIRNFFKINAKKEVVENLKLIVMEEVRWVAI